MEKDGWICDRIHPSFIQTFIKYRRLINMGKGKAFSKIAAIILFICIAALQKEVQVKASNLVDIPARYEAENGNVKFVCDIEVPETVKEQGIYLDEVEAYIYADADTITPELTKDKEISEQYDTPGSDGLPGTSMTIYADKTQLITGGSFLYTSAFSIRYLQIGLMDYFKDAVQEELNFEKSEKSIATIKQVLETMNIPADAFKFNWFSLNKAQLEEMEQHNIENGYLEKEKSVGVWTDEDEIYFIYGVQFEQEIPVFHELMGLYQQFALDAIDNSPIMAIYSPRGLEYLSIDRVYNLKRTSEKAQLLEFKEIAKVVEDKYNNLLGDIKYVVERAKLFQMVRRNEAQELIAEPVWRFEIDGNISKKLVTLVNAETGKEIYLP